MCPFSVKTMIPCRTDRSILKVIVMSFGPASQPASQPAMALLSCCHRGSQLTKMQHGVHMQSTETKGPEEKLGDGIPATTGFPGIERRDLLLLRDEPVFLDPQLLDFRVQRRSGNSEFRCRTFWAGDFPFAFS
jgi:hypothetical protein